MTKVFCTWIAKPPKPYIIGTAGSSSFKSWYDGHRLFETKEEAIKSLQKITAYEVRAIGFDLPENIPDAAVTDRSAFFCGLKVGEVKTDDDITAVDIISGGMEFTWIDLTIKVGLKEKEKKVEEIVHCSQYKKDDPDALTCADCGVVCACVQHYKSDIPYCSECVPPEEN